MSALIRELLFFALCDVRNHSRDAERVYRVTDATHELPRLLTEPENRFLRGLCADYLVELAAVYPEYGDRARAFAREVGRLNAV